MTYMSTTMTGRVLVTGMATLKLAAQFERELHAEYLEYLAECDADRANGHRPHYCEHGMNQWVDYDNICGYCEDGLSMRDGVFRRRVALDRAKARWQEVLDGINLLTTARELGLLEFIDVDALTEHLGKRMGNK